MEEEGRRKTLQKPTHSQPCNVYFLVCALGWEEDPGSKNYWLTLCYKTTRGRKWQRQISRWRRQKAAGRPAGNVWRLSANSSQSINIGWARSWPVLSLLHLSRAPWGSRFVWSWAVPSRFYIRHLPGALFRVTVFFFPNIKLAFSYFRLVIDS